MRNPFRYGGVVEDEAFCNRKQELADLLRAMENGEKLFVHAERRMGKTSLVQRALGQLNAKYARAIYVDLWPTEGELSFTTATAKAIVEATATRVDQLLEVAKRFFSRLAPNVTLDDEGKPQINFGVRQAEDALPQLEEVLSVPAKLALQEKKRVVVVFDEFQQVLEYGGDLVERKLRSSIQTQQDVAYLFLGSRKHLIQKMFLDQARPLYRAGGHYPLGPIAEPHWRPFIQTRFAQADKRIGPEHIAEVCTLTGGHPFYTQHLCHTLWERCEIGSEVNGELIVEAVQLLLDRESYAYATLWESLTGNQRRFLTGLAHSPTTVKPFSADFLRAQRLGSPSNAQRAAETLIERDVVARDNGTFVIVDRFFRLWLLRMES